MIGATEISDYCTLYLFICYWRPAVVYCPEKSHLPLEWTLEKKTWKREEKNTSVKYKKAEHLLMSMN